MRIVYVAGFFAPVLKELQSHIPTELDNRSVIWIPQTPTGDLNINRFKGSFYDVVGWGASNILVCVFVFPGREHLLDGLQAIVDQGKQKSTKLNVTIEVFESARDTAGIRSKIASFAPTVEISPPYELDSLEQWVRARYSQKILLHPRAINSAKNSRYEDISLIYAAIAALGTEYWQMRTAKKERALECRERCDAKLLELGLVLSPSISMSRAGEEGDEYFVNYPVATENKKFLELHLKKGSDREERFCLRIYFFWDDAAKRVVIGWLPSHLGTRAT